MKVGTITVTNLDSDTRAALQARAAAHGRSVKAEVRAILRAAVLPEKQAVTAAAPETRRGLGTRLHEIAMEFGGFDLQIPPRDQEPVRIITFDDE